MAGWKHKTKIIVGNDKNPAKMETGQVIINKKATKQNLDKLIDINNDGLDFPKQGITTDGTDGGLLKGKPHYDKNGNPLGGIPVEVDGGKKIEVEGDEFVVNKEASQKHWKELSKINQSAGNGVPIHGSDVGVDEDPEEFAEGGKIEFNPNHLPSKKIYNFAKMVKQKYPKVWDMGGNIFGNEAFKNLERVLKRGYWTDNEEWMYKKWRSYVARHHKDFRIAGTVAMLKWIDKIDKGWPYMKDLIQKEIDKKYNKKKEGGTVTYKQKYNKKYGYDKNESHNLKEISKDTGVSKKGLQQIYNKGVGAYKTNPESVRPNVKSKEQWAMGRVYSAVMGGKAARVDANELKMENGGNLYHLGGDMSKHLAPNGKPSNLNHEQWHLVRTPEFKAWFGDWENDPENASKVVDENGEPLVVYHGTYRDFSIFDLNKVGNVDKGFFSKGFYFTPNESLAYNYGNKIYKCYLNIKSPIITKSKNDLANYLGLEYNNNTYSELAREKIISLNYDGVLQEYNLPKGARALYPFIEIVAYFPNQIKLADGSNITFDGSNPDIRYDKGGEVLGIISGKEFKKKYLTTISGFLEKAFFDSGDDINSMGSVLGDGIYYSVTIDSSNHYESDDYYLGTDYFELADSAKIILINDAQTIGGNKVKKLALQNKADGAYDTTEGINNNPYLGLAIYNPKVISNTTFDGSNPDIRYDKGGNIVNNACVEELVNLIDSHSEIKYWVVDKNTNNLVIVFKEEIGVYDVEIYNNFLKKLTECSNVFDKEVEIQYDNKEYKTIFVKLKTSNIDYIEMKNGGNINKADIYFSVHGLVKTPNVDVMYHSLYDRVQGIDKALEASKVMFEVDKDLDRVEIIGDKTKTLYYAVTKNADGSLNFESKDLISKQIQNVVISGRQYGEKNSKYHLDFINNFNGKDVSSVVRSIYKFPNEEDYKKVKEYIKENSILVNNYDDKNNVITFDDQIMELGGELKKGIEAEKEHIGTAEKLYQHQITPSESAESIAKEHLKEDPKYYTKLQTIEKPKIMENLYYLAIGNTITEKSSGYIMEIVDYSKDGIVVKRVTRFENLQPSEWKFEYIVDDINKGLITFDGKEYSTDRDKSLLECEINNIKESFKMTTGGGVNWSDYSILKGDKVIVDAGRFKNEEAEVIGIGKETGIDNGYKVKFKDGSIAIVFFNQIKKANVDYNKLEQKLDRLEYLGKKYTEVSNKINNIYKEYEELFNEQYAKFNKEQKEGMEKLNELGLTYIKSGKEEDKKAYEDYGKEYNQIFEDHNKKLEKIRTDREFWLEELNMELKKISKEMFSKMETGGGIDAKDLKYKVAYAGSGFYGIYDSINDGPIIGEMSKEEAQQEANKKNGKMENGGNFENKLDKLEYGRGGNIIGKTKSGKNVYSSKNAIAENQYTSQDHKDAAYINLNKAIEYTKKGFNSLADNYNNEFDRHIESSKYKQISSNIKEQGGNVGDVIKIAKDMPYMASLSNLYGKDLKVIDVKDVFFASGNQKYFTVDVDGEQYEVPERFTEKMAKGGGIANKYIKYSKSNMSNFEVWSSWNENQKKHFLKDHLDEIIEAGQQDELTEKEILDSYNKKYGDLSAHIRGAIERHINEDKRYSTGGGVGDSKYNEQTLITHVPRHEIVKWLENELNLKNTNLKGLLYFDDVDLVLIDKTVCKDCIGPRMDEKMKLSDLANILKKYIKKNKMQLNEEVEGFERLPSSIKNNELYVTFNNFKSTYDSLMNGDDFDEKRFQGVINDLIYIKNQAKRFKSAEEIEGTEYMATGGGVGDEVITIELDMGWDNSNPEEDKAAKKAFKKYKIKVEEIEEQPGTFEVTGKKKDIISYLKSDFYEADDEFIKDYYPELLEDKMATGGVTYYNKDNEYKLSRPSGSIEKEILDKVVFKSAIDSRRFIGNFGWKTEQGKLADGYLYELDEFDQDFIKDLKLKNGEKVFRYVNRTTAIGGITPFIKINVNKALLYFPIQTEKDELVFETKGVKPLWINLIEK